MSIEVTAGVECQSQSYRCSQASAATCAQSSPHTHRVHKAATGMSPSPQATAVTARRLSDPLGYPIRTNGLWLCGARAKAILPFIYLLRMYADFPYPLPATEEGLWTTCVWALSVFTDCKSPPFSWVPECGSIYLLGSSVCGCSDSFASVENIITNLIGWSVKPIQVDCVFVCVCVCWCVATQRSLCLLQFVVNKTCNAASGLNASHCRLLQQGKIICNLLLEHTWLH